MGSTVNAALAYARAFFEGEASGHDFWHTWRVWKTAERLAEAEGADGETVALAALLHDVDDAKLSPATAADKANAVGFLRQQGLAEDRIAAIVHIIEQVSYKGEDSAVPDSLEGQCVQDADRLDAIGAIGIARTFAFGGSRGRIIWDPESRPRTHLREADYRSDGGCTLNHFYEKLLLLRDMMNTPAARAMAEHRHQVMTDYLAEFYAEWEGTR